MTERRRSLIVAGAMALAVAAVYLPPGVFDGRHALFGLDFAQLHEHRIRFARESLAAGALPAWYPRELDGAPFRANLQSFPLVPTRPLLYLFDPALGLTVGATLAAELAALFTFLYLRRLGLRPLPSAAAGWTFACAGYFAARVLAGHLPLLEAYPALPALLWLAERPPSTGALLGLAAGTAAVALAGHPQLPVYAVAVTAAYLAVRRGRAAARPLGAMALGAGSTLFAWWPMLRLAARSARTLALDPPTNDLPLPWGRLAALIAPWRDGWPALVERRPLEPFHGYPTTAWFWDTVGYVGLLPLAAAAALGLLALLRRSPGERRRVGTFFAATGLLAILTALPWRSALLAHGPTILRSPARQLYVVTFALALAVGAGLEALLRAERLGPLRQRLALALLLLALHGLDLGGFTHSFMHLSSRAGEAAPAALAIVEAELHDGRVAIDVPQRLGWNRRFDDVGFFDSLPLRDSYAAILAAGGLPAGLDTEVLDGSALSAPALAANSVRFVASAAERPDLVARAPLPWGRLYEVPSPSPRAEFVPASAARFLDEAATLDELRRAPRADGTRILLPPGVLATPAEPVAAIAPPVRMERPSSDALELAVEAPGAGWLRVVESWDPGWEARVDGRTAPVLRADGHLLAVRLEAGAHRVALRYRTPGATAGAAMSLASLALLALLLRRRRGARA